MSPWAASVIGYPEVVALVGGDPVGDDDSGEGVRRGRRRVERGAREPEGRGEGKAAGVDDRLLLGEPGPVRRVRRAAGRAGAGRRLVGDGAAVRDARVEEGAGGRVRARAAEPLGALGPLLHGHEVAGVAVDAVVVEVGEEVGVGDVGDVVVGDDGAQVDELGGQLLGKVDGRGAGVGVGGEGVGDLAGELLADRGGGFLDDLGEGVLAECGVGDVVEWAFRPVEERGQRVDDAAGIGRRRKGLGGRARRPEWQGSRRGG